MTTVYNLIDNQPRRIGSSPPDGRVGDDLTGTGYGRSSVQAVIFPGPGQLRSRKVVSRSNARSTGKHPSWKMKRMLQWESTHELNAFRLLDCDPDVANYSEQPCKIVYVMDGVERIHYPDILVATTAGKELWEVKPLSKALEPEVLPRTQFLSRALPEWGYDYRMVFAEDLARQPRLSNANLLLLFGTREVDDRNREDLRREVDERGSLVWLKACSGDYGVKGRESLCSLALRGILAFDINAPISSTTRFVARRRL